jgi:2,3,4,5-tetrahydropyridine-2-carboxylate N-succinyltransferase
MKELIEEFYANPEKFSASEKHVDTVRAVISDLNAGKLRVCEKNGAEWKLNEWVKKAVLLFFRTQKMEKMDGGAFDKVPLKNWEASLGVRAVPGSVARYGAYIAPSVILMPLFVNIGVYVDEGTMVDIWVIVGSCAQIGKGVHLSGGVGIGGVLEPLQAAPVVIEDHCFIGSRAIVVEGVRVSESAVLGANVVLTASTPIIDVRGKEEKIYKGFVPPRSVVVPGTRKKTFPSGEYQLNCALIIGERTASTDQKTSLNSALRDFEVSI